MTTSETDTSAPRRTQPARPSPRGRIKGIVLLIAVAGAAWGAWKYGLLGGGKPAEHGPAGGQDKLIALSDKRPDTVRFASTDAVGALGIKIDVVRESPPPQPLRLPGTLFLDPERLVHVHSRFAGEVVAIGTITEGEKSRPIRYGDHVKKGDLLAKVWSREIGEKKSEYVEALARLEVNRALLNKLTGVTRGIVAEREVMEARRNVEADMVAATRVERTLRSWRIADDELATVRNEAKMLQEGKETSDPDVSRRWAETEVRAPRDGTIVEKNFNVGDIIETHDDLFKVADLSRLQVMVNVYEEDLWAVRALPANKRKWKLDLKSDPTDNAIEGTFEMIGSVIDPAQRTGVLIGWLDNPDQALAVGQFITATIELPPDLGLVAIPESALVEDGASSSIFVQSDDLHFTRRKVDVVRRANGVVLIRKTSSADKDSAPHSSGEVIAVAGVLGLGGELSNMQADAPGR